MAVASLSLPQPIVIGRGNVAYYFSRILGAEMVNPHEIDNLPLDASLYIMAVSDDAIPQLANKMPKLSGLVVHTTGTMPMDVLKDVSPNHGVIYPLQTLTKGVDILPCEVPLLVEGSNPRSRKLLEDLALSIGSPCRVVSSAERAKIHVAAVFANNFANHMWTVAQNLLPDHELLNPLIKQTLAKALAIGPQAAQTGPARRHDQETIRRHLSLLPEKYRQLYAVVTQSIQNQ